MDPDFSGIKNFDHLILRGSKTVKSILPDRCHTAVEDLLHALLAARPLEATERVNTFSNRLWM